MGLEIERTLEHVRFLAKHFTKDQAERLVIVLLMELGIPTHYDGFDYLAKAISIFCTDPTQMIMKGLYPAIARQYNRDIEASHIEQAIRGAIQCAWKRHDDVTWRRYFPSGEAGALTKPTNTEFVSRLAYVVELWKGTSLEEVQNENT